MYCRHSKIDRTYSIRCWARLEYSGVAKSPDDYCTLWEARDLETMRKIEAYEREVDRVRKIEIEKQLHLFN